MDLGYLAPLEGEFLLQRLQEKESGENSCLPTGGRGAGEAVWLPGCEAYSILRGQGSLSSLKDSTPFRWSRFQLILELEIAKHVVKCCIISILSWIIK